MNISHFLAFRYLRSSRENRFFSWITILSALGIAIGVAALIVVLSVIDGFEHELKNRFLSANAHIMAYRYPAGMAAPEKWMRTIKKDFPKEIKGTAPFIHYETMVKNGSIMHAVLVRGISPQLREQVQSIKELVTPANALDLLQKEIDDAKAGSPKPEIPGLIMGSGLLSIIDSKIGDIVYLIAPNQSEFTEVKAFKIIGKYHSGLKHYDNRLAALSLSTAKDFFNMGQIVTGLEIGLYHADDSAEITQRMGEKYHLTFREWKSFNRPLFDAMKKERVVISLCVAMVIIVAGFNILTTVFVSVSQKQREISILKALGARNRQIVYLFVNQGIYIGLLGGLGGNGLALAISGLLEKYQFIDLPDPYFLKHLPIHYDWTIYAGVSLAGVIICIISGIYPAITASKASPAEGIRGLGNPLT